MLDWYARYARHIGLLLLVALLASLLPSAHLSGAPAALAAAAPPAPLTVAPILPPAEARLPALALGVALAPDPLTVGETAVITLTLSNGAPDPAEDLVVTLPTPDGALAMPGPATLGADQGWQWQIGHLDGASSLTLTAALRLVRLPQGGALLLRPQASAHGLTLPTSTVGGALAMPADRSPATAAFRPGAVARLRSRDGRVAVNFPSRAFARPLTLRHARTPLLGGMPRDTVGWRRGLGSFFLDAIDSRGSAVHQFAAPLTISVSYTPEQLQARGIGEADLTLFWFDPAQKRWFPLPTQLDSTTQTASAVVDHFSVFQLADGSSPSATYIPSLQGFQVSSFTGAASYRVPIEIPAGPTGLKPALELSYSSAATDGPGGERPKGQASWVGKGWSFDPGGAVAVNKSLAGQGWDNFSFVFGGRSFDAVRGDLTQVAMSGRTCTDYINDQAWWECWTWHAADETFDRVQVDRDASGNPQWHVWSKDGTRYDFTQPLWWRWDEGGTATRQIYKWLLSQVSDPHGNKLVYDYQIDPATLGGTPYNPTYFLSAIRWGFDGATPGTGTARYRVRFGVGVRAAAPTAGVDTQWEYPESTSTYYQAVTPHEAYRLDSIQVQSMPPGTSSYQLVRQYNLQYADVNGSVQTDDYSGQKVLTLLSVQRVGSDGTLFPNNTTPIKTSFTYNTNPDLAGGNTRPAGFNRIATIDNGQGGRISFSYAHPWAKEDLATGECWCNYRNYHRVERVLAQDISGKRYSSSTLTTYSYTGPALNDEGHAATVVYARYPSSSNGDSRIYLAHQEKREFRGHATVVEKQYNGVTIDAPLLMETQHWFYQGDNGCLPAFVTLGNGSQAVDESDSCFMAMVEHESWKGREYLTDVRIPGSAAGANPLQRTIHTFSRVALPFFGSSSGTAGVSNHYKRVGLWRAFNFESQTDQQQVEGTGSPVVKTTKTFYNANCVADTPATLGYGNVSCIQEFSGATLVRQTKRWFAALATPTTYLVDRMWGEDVLDGATGLLTIAHLFYDALPNGTTTGPSVGTLGDLRFTRTYYDVPLAGCCSNITLHGMDTRYDYDVYGNQTSMTTYAGAGTFLNGVYSVPGAGSAARTTTTSYDTTFHVFPTRVDQPTVTVALFEQAAYDYRMGTLTSVTDLNGNVTSAGYDVFGRMTTLVKPGDSASFPTVRAIYDDNATPFRYEIDRREVAGSAAVRVEQQFYDGLGRRVQTKAESVNGAQNIVVDTRYDGLSQVVGSSQPRYVNESGAAFTAYTDPGPTLFNATTTTYDGLGRLRRVTTPDGKWSEHLYGITGSLTFEDVVDANRHRVQYRHDALGRLAAVVEITGDCGTGSYAWATCVAPYTTTWAADATTSYSYSPLDQLKTVTDQPGNVTTLTYDSLGRKRTMADPDMGTWSYSYDANGNLTAQTDAQLPTHQTITFTYDALNRLTSKTLPGNVASYYAYDQLSPAGNVINGKGRRTAMSTAVGGVQQSYDRWEYDARGRVRLAGQNVAGVVTDLISSYDSADRLTTLRYYEANETVSYTYDGAWRPLSACSNLPSTPCYVSTATYTALDQPKQRTTGNGVVQTWTYASPLQRLAQLQIGGAFNRAYTYDSGGNVETIADSLAGQTQNFDYDHLDRLTHAWTTGAAVNAYNEGYTYTRNGNLTSKTGSGVYAYPAGGSARPHTPTSVGGAAYSYDGNGNLTSGGGRTYTWDAENRVASVSQVSGSESYGYDADGERVKKVRGSVTTISFGGVWEQEIGGAQRLYYTFNGQVVAMRDSGTGAVTYLHGDHLGSASVAMSAAGVASVQEYTPFGSHRGSSTIAQTDRDYTGQQLDGTGLLYYHARMYDPVLGRFVSPDSVVPGSASGSMDGIALKPLTVDFHEPAFVATLNGENQQRFWFQMSGDERRKVGSPWGPANPQALNRYSYVLNNPLRYVDPTGHSQYLTSTEAEALSDALASLADEIEGPARPARITGIIALALSAMPGPVAAAVKMFLGAIAAAANRGMVDVATLRKLAIMIDEANEGHSAGVAIAAHHDAWLGNYVTVRNRSNGQPDTYNVGWFFYTRYIPSTWQIGWAHGDYASGGWVFAQDFDKSGTPYDRPLDASICGVNRDLEDC